MKIKIGFDGRVFLHKNITGVERYSYEIYKYMKKIKKSDITLFKPSSKNRYLHHLWVYTYLPYQAKKKNVDVLFCPAGAAPFNLVKNILLGVTIHDIAFLNYPELYSRAFRLYYKLVLPFIINRANIIFAVSNNEKRRIEEYYPHSRGKIFTVYEGVSSIFVNRNHERKKIILAVASLNKNKNLSSLLRAFKKTLRDIPHKLILVGGVRKITSSDHQALKLVNSIPSDRIEMTGYINDEQLVNYYNIAELFVFPSLYEGFGLPPLEAMACGCPVVVSNTASLPEVCGDAAYYVDPYDVDSIAEGIYKVLIDENLRKTLIQKGLERAKLFNWEKTARQILRVFEEVLRKS